MDKKYSERTHYELMRYYFKNGLNKTIDIAYDMLASTNHKANQEFRTQVHGEICESILECSILDYVRKHNNIKLDWAISKGLILKDLDNPESEYLTEIDLTLFTPSRIISFECKSYSGDKTIKDICTITRPKGTGINVYKQHAKHIQVLEKTFKPFRYKTAKTKGMQACVFDFSLGSVKDIREDKYRDLMPFIQVQDIPLLLNSIIDKPAVYDMDLVRRCITILEKNKRVYTKKHLKYVTSLHQKKK